MLGFSKKGIRFKLLSGFIAVLLLTLIMGVYNFISMVDISNDVIRMKNTISKQVGILSKIELTIKEIQEDFTDAAVTRERGVDDEVHEDLKIIHASIDEFNRIEEVPEVIQKFKAMKQSSREFFEQGNTMLTAFRNSEEAGTREMKNFDKSADKLISFFEDMREEHVGEMNSQFDDVYGDTKRSITISSTLAVLAIVLGLIIALAISSFISKILLKISNSLKLSSDQVASSAHELAGSSQSLAEGANQQAVSIEETSASIEEISGMVASSVENLSSAVEASNSAMKSSENGNNSMEQLQDSMKNILASNEKIEELVKVIGDIGEKTQVMDEIVFQTKLLSFNASVEAERAGEHGRGFAVVAQEVGNLAQLSGNAAQEIDKIVKTSIKDAKEITTENKKRVEQGNSFVTDTANILNEILKFSTSSSQSSEQVLGATKDQRDGIKQITMAMSELDKVTQKNASSAEETANSSKNLNDMVTTLEDAAEVLSKFIVGDDSRPVQIETPAISSPTRPEKKQTQAPTDDTWDTL